MTAGVPTRSPKSMQPVPFWSRLRRQTHFFLPPSTGFVWKLRAWSSLALGSPLPKASGDAPSTKRLKLTAGDPFNGSGVLCAGAHQLTLQTGCASGRVAQLSAMGCNASPDHLRSPSQAESAAAHAAAIAQAIKASGVVVRLEAGEFLRILHRQDEPLIVLARGGFLKPNGGTLQLTRAWHSSRNHPICCLCRGEPKSSRPRRSGSRAS